MTDPEFEEKIREAQRQLADKLRQARSDRHCGEVTVRVQLMHGSHLQTTVTSAQTFK